MKLDVTHMTELSEALEAMARGEEVALVKDGREVARLAGIETTEHEPTILPNGVKIGILPPGTLGKGPDWFEPMDDAELDLWDGREAG
ncbi:hypothetical protein [Jannaschia sp. LMIT008]|uniref:hypothetical protein n=1 Tax=Jannaschia maritima TaxID=3032585 RepID=UPI002811540B|nr:hypothetical protein [Jannaschia sp. LMIT008]